MFQSTLNNIIVKIETRYIRNFTKILNLAAIQNLTSIEKADYVNIVGTVVSVPLEISTWKREYRGYSADDVMVGDTVVFSHNVIFDFVQKSPEADPIFKNSFWYKNNEYWRCNILELYAVVRDGEIRMQNGFVMVENIMEEPRIYLPQHLRRKANIGTGIVTQIQDNGFIHRGDTVFYNQSHLRTYQINEKPFGILKIEQILGKSADDGT
jgi:co-chaperonin GroES (HSP10)